MAKKNLVRRTFDVLSALRHNGKRYKSGDQVDLTDTEALEVVGLGVVTLANDQSNAPDANDGSSSVDLNKMSKAQIVEHAKDEHGLDLDVELKKPDLIAKVQEAQAAKE